MGHEKKILLTLLCLLSGTFVGVLSAKLLVPRPPAGAGPDVHADAVVAAPHEIVEPPSLADRPAPPPAVRAEFDEPAVASAAAEPEAAPAADPPEPVAASGFAAPAIEPAGAGVATDAAVREDPADMPVERPAGRGRRDPFVARAAWEEPVAASEPVRDPEPPVATRVEVGGYTTVAGDSWWSLAERAYGDGRLYRALFAWNRAIDPRISLVPGTRLDVPPRQRLESSSPNLIPAR